MNFYRQNSRNVRASVLAVLLLTVVQTGCAEKGVVDQNSASTIHPSPYAEISLNYEKQSGYASNQFAVWIEDFDGDIIRTLYVTRFTANGGYKNRPDSIPIWVKKSGIESMEKSDVDAITGATPRTSPSLSYYWDLKDTNGKTVPSGDYKYFVEGSLRWKNHVIYSGVISVGDNPNFSEAAAEFSFEASDSQPALSETAQEVKMISGVRAEFFPQLPDAETE